MPNANWTNDQIQQQISKNMETHSQDLKILNEKEDKTMENSVKNRKIMVVGCGDAGCNIASDIKKALANDDVFTIAYNTSDRSKNLITNDLQIYEKTRDGSGKDRTLSKEIFKDRSFNELLNRVKEACVNTNFQYIIVTTSVDGGTGSGVSPIVAKLISDNVVNSEGDPIPVIVIGVYPREDEDAMSQYNSLSWQADVEKIALPYMIFDNNMTKIIRSVNDKADGNLVIHKTINAEIVKAIKLISGNTYGNSTFMIDDRDLYMILNHVGKRIVFAQNTVKPTVNQSIDDYVLAMLEENHQPLPKNVRGMGLFIKGPAELINRTDTSLKKVSATYGEPMVHYNHLENSDNITITILLSGCDIPDDRMYIMKERYNDIMKVNTASTSSAVDFLTGIDNPLGNRTSGKKSSGDKSDDSFNKSALDL